jgi:hypothetical protein
MIYVALDDGFVTVGTNTPILHLEFNNCIGAHPIALQPSTSGMAVGCGGCLSLGSSVVLALPFQRLFAVFVAVLASRLRVPHIPFMSLFADFLLMKGQPHSTFLLFTISMFDPPSALILDKPTCAV